MKKNIRIVLIALFAIPAFYSKAQSQPDHFVYAITALKKDGTSWMALRKLNTQTGEFSNIMLDGTDKSVALYDAASRKRLDHFISDTATKNNPQLVFGSSAAAIAYDKENNRLYYTPMLVDQLRYIDLATMKVFCVTGQSFSKAAQANFQSANAISRMVIAPDGYGYTITNDGNHLFRFSTTANSVITDLGELIDDASNKETIHNACGNGGGDIVADDNGNLFLVSASNKVFKVNINTKLTQFIGSISGLPEKFTTNGTAVDEDGKLILSSSIYTDAYFAVDPKTWIASPYQTTNGLYSSADLANSNTLFASSTAFLKIPLNKSNKIKAYPNPVSGNVFNIQFNNLAAGNYTIQLSDAIGNAVLQHKVKITQSSQTETVNISSTYSAQGFYFLRIVDENNIAVFTQIMVVER